MFIKVLRIHYNPESDSYEYEIYDRDGKFIKNLDYPIEIFNLPKVKRFGFCNLETVDVTLEFETPLDSNEIKRHGV